MKKELIWIINVRHVSLKEHIKLKYVICFFLNVGKKFKEYVPGRNVFIHKIIAHMGIKEYNMCVM
jgi:hypothetical protein